MTTSSRPAFPAVMPVLAGVARAGWIPYHSPFANTETAQVNKAFVKESDGADDGDEELAPAQRLPAGSKNYMTRRGYDALRVELDQLVRIERPKLVETVAWAAGNGDRSENGDYIYGKKRLREIDRRIRFLVRRLDRAEVVEAFTLTQEGERSPLAGAVTNVRAASFPSAPQARAVTVTAVRANGPTADRPGQLER